MLAKVSNRKKWDRKVATPLSEMIGELKQKGVISSD
jgi:hypothetical protein